MESPWTTLVPELLANIFSHAAPSTLTASSLVHSHWRCEAQRTLTTHITLRSYRQLEALMTTLIAHNTSALGVQTLRVRMAPREEEAELPLEHPGTFNHPWAGASGTWGLIAAHATASGWPHLHHFMGHPGYPGPSFANGSSSANSNANASASASASASGSASVAANAGSNGDTTVGPSQGGTTSAVHGPLPLTLANPPPPAATANPGLPHSGAIHWQHSGVTLGPAATLHSSLPPAPPPVHVPATSSSTSPYFPLDPLASYQPLPSSSDTMPWFFDPPATENSQLPTAVPLAAAPFQPGIHYYPQASHAPAAMAQDDGNAPQPQGLPGQVPLSFITAFDNPPAVESEEEPDWGFVADELRPEPNEEQTRDTQIAEAPSPSPPPKPHELVDVVAMTPSLAELHIGGLDPALDISFSTSDVIKSLVPHLTSFSLNAMHQWDHPHRLPNLFGRVLKGWEELRHLALGQMQCLREPVEALGMGFGGNLRSLDLVLCEVSEAQLRGLLKASGESLRALKVVGVVRPNVPGWSTSGLDAKTVLDVLLIDKTARQNVKGKGKEKEGVDYAMGGIGISLGARMQELVLALGTLSQTDMERIRNGFPNLRHLGLPLGNSEGLYPLPWISPPPMDLTSTADVFLNSRSVHPLAKLSLFLVGPHQCPDCHPQLTEEGLSRFEAAASESWPVDLKKVFLVMCGMNPGRATGGGIAGLGLHEDGCSGWVSEGPRDPDEIRGMREVGMEVLRSMSDTRLRRRRVF